MTEHDIHADLKIFATDLGKEAIRVGGLGIYPQNIVADVPKDLLTKYFVNRGDNFQINERIRQMVVFANHNVTSDPPFSKINLVVCRNLLIYFNNEIQNKVQSMFQYSLSQGGFMFLGSSESIVGNSDAFEVVDSKWKIFKYKEGYLPVSLSNLITPQQRVNNVVSDLAKTIDAGFGKTNNLTNLYEKTLNYFAPAGVIVDSNNTIIHFFKDIKRYLSFPEGKATFNLLELADPQLTMVLSNMLFKARKERKEINLSKFKFKENDNTLYLNISAKVLSEKKNSIEYTVLSIVETKNVEKVSEPSDEEFDFNEQAAERIRDLERELIYRDENLQTTIEELETSNEELQATNEELVSSNEELQSTNEELQSVNEELYTVNSQYQEKIHELTDLHNDVSNLLSNTNIGTIFLDANLVVRKFTSEIKKTINVMDVDIGRPFSHITFNCKYSGLLELAQHVLETLKNEEIEIMANDGKCYLMKIQPYRHADNSIRGILITQVNIDKLHQTRMQNIKLSKAIEQSAMGTIITDVDGTIEYVNKKYCKLTGYSANELIGKNPRIFKSNMHNADFYQQIWSTIKAGKAWKGKICNMTKRGELFWENATISPIMNSEGKIVNFIAVKEDISHSRNIEEELEIQSSIIKTIEENSKIGTWSYTLKNNTSRFSQNCYSILGLEDIKIPLTREKIFEQIHPDDVKIVSEQFSAALKAGENFELSYRLAGSGDQYSLIHEKVMTYKDNMNELVRFVGIIRVIVEDK